MDGQKGLNPTKKLLVKTIVYNLLMYVLCVIVAILLLNLLGGLCIYSTLHDMSKNLSCKFQLLGDVGQKVYTWIKLG